jgi:formate dehydrogenase accessory protein FdhD
MAHPHEPALDAVEEVPVWLEVNGTPTVTWMCTPDQLDALVVGWLHGEGYIDTLSDLVRMRPCAQELGFWVDVSPERWAAVEASDRTASRAAPRRRPPSRCR